MQAQLSISQGECWAWKALCTFTCCYGRCKLKRIRLQKGWFVLYLLSPHLCEALDPLLQERHCKMEEISKAPQSWLGLKHLPGEQRLRRPWEVVKSHLGQLKNQIYKVLSNLILAGLSLRKVVNQVAFRVNFQPWLSCASVHHKELLFQSSNKNSGHWCVLCFWTKLKRNKGLGKI